MKRIILSTMLASVMTAGMAAESPIDKGVYAVAGAVSYSRTKSDSQTLTSLNIAPSLRYYIQPRLAVGASVSYQKAVSEQVEHKSYGMGPLVRYHFSDAGLRPFVQLQYFFVNADSKSKVANVSTASADTRESAVSVGADYFLARNVALEPSLTYSRRKLDYPDGWPIDTDHTERELRLFIAVSVFIY